MRTAWPKWKILNRKQMNILIRQKLGRLVQKMAWKLLYLQPMLQKTLIKKITLNIGQINLIHSQTVLKTLLLLQNHMLEETPEREKVNLKIMPCIIWNNQKHGQIIQIIIKKKLLSMLVMHLHLLMRHLSTQKLLLVMQEMPKII